ncbi:nicotinate-nucleotide adenylyltransferase [Metamycoplasma hyosynoviae]|uniref:Probable nicotinate-nucleotide adenylyltransferase n=2 Tax=Metamycoplasma hyosynoviae TaxID=29559 RepID=A0AAP4ALQ2_9BACT|nr:nicotinate-nucleotide adenylyltransferase [Metamycoplasma hyosynoviae]MDC8913594.1 nicotinate-nucleotide adenylyltransferase [Metamycoplasma hyosynoviae]MDC8916207.1 nicotinate-nucleotide adenylyltransferase [Metamycoplasma hyosynoviae]MDC8919012.1 nicotinate-nucleotide adenylyltransferase [Metamycoplasma hyosynoviae]MDC8919842.1 nicotinate-nucleotide adenylyltransferase [Metamycoplasma hyosynoviae]MDC8962432.1 nicotinate-nucleotide adenylyltransferase [Metamycoplasma hyosynoviae]
MKIGIFGGSFNPIHKGHILIAEDAIQELGLDELYFVPANKNPFKKNQDYESSEHRINMIKLVISHNPKMKISEFETNRNTLSYTIDTVEYFVSKFKDAKFYFLIGSDNLPKLHKWKEIDKISELVKISVFNRTKKYKHLNFKKYNCLQLNNKFYDFSSTNYRKGNLQQVDEKVQKYIGSNFLYFDEIAKHSLSHFRYYHLKQTADFALKLSKYLKPNDKEFHIKAYRAGYMHDITKEWSNEKSFEYLKKYGEENILPYKYHQTTAYYFLKYDYMYPDEEVLDSIKVHTTLSLDPTLLDKILYVADKIGLGRTWKGVQKLRNLAFKDFDKCLDETIKVCCLDYNCEKGIIFTPDQKEIYEKILKIKL